ncbi:MAG TPA: hypothetical protein V6D28_23915 [Leptolyngbyaceae cyanobacterium]
MNHRLIGGTSLNNLLFVLIFLTVISLTFAFLIIKDFSHPLAGNINDDNVWEYMGFYLAKNLNFSPLPQINFHNNQVFYPYGTSSVLQPWGIEQSGFYAILYLLFGIGPWLQIYYSLSLLMTALGTFALLFRDYGLMRSTGAGLIVTFLNFYTIHKYPSHLSLAITHWLVFSFIVDFLIVKRVALKQYLSLRLILLRACLMILCLGQDLGYITGFALVSFTVSILFILGLIFYRYCLKKFNIRKSLVELIKTYQKELLNRYVSCFSLIGISLIATYIYLPLAFQIARESKSFDFSQIFFGAWWPNPLRLLMPFLPGINIAQNDGLQGVFGDLIETPFDGMVGWFLLIIGSVGLWQSRKRITPYIPLIIILILCLLYHPALFPTLKIFPWFAFNRAAGRSTIIYPIIFCLFSLNLNFNSLRFIYRNLLTALLVGLACTEFYTAYSLKLSAQPYTFDRNFFAYMNYVKQQPGEAVLDWPFCSGMAGILCPYWSFNGGIYAQRRFHEKKVMGQYFARVHPSQLEPYFQAGWNKLFAPDSPDPVKAKRQTRCFRADEWDFFTDFFKFNDFAGINLYVDLLPADCVTEFYRRFGHPAIATLSPGVGRVEFIPKSAELRTQVNPALGASLKFNYQPELEPIFNFSKSDLLKFNSPFGLTVTGLGNIETDADGINFRWSTDDETYLKFKLSDYQSLEITFNFVNGVAGQDVVVKANGAPLQKMFNLKKGENVESTLKFKGIPGWNYIIFSYRDFDLNGNRRLAVKFKKLRIYGSL